MELYLLQTWSINTDDLARVGCNGEKTGHALGVLSEPECPLRFFGDLEKIQVSIRS